LSTTGKTIGPPCGAGSPTPASIAITEPTADPVTIEGLTLLGASPRGFLLLRSGNPPSPQA